MFFYIYILDITVSLKKCMRTAIVQSRNTILKNRPHVRNPFFFININRTVDRMFTNSRKKSSLSRFCHYFVLQIIGPAKLIAFSSRRACPKIAHHTCLHADKTSTYINKVRPARTISHTHRLYARGRG